MFAAGNFIKETTTTDPHSDNIPITLLGAVAGFRPFSSLAVGTRFIYTIKHQAVDEWETGLGYLVDSTTIQKVKAHEFHNATDVWSNGWTAGTKDIYLSGTGWLHAGNGLTLDSSFSSGAQAAWYVATTGLDTNAGTSASKLLTLQKAVDLCCSELVLGKSAAPTIRMAAGTYSGNVTIGRLRTYGYNPQIGIYGSGTTFDGASATLPALKFVDSGRWLLQAVNIGNTGGGPGLVVSGSSVVTLSGMVVMFPCGTSAIVVEEGGTLIIVGATLEFSAQTLSGSCIECNSGGRVIFAHPTTTTSISINGGITATQGFISSLRGGGYFDFNKTTIAATGFTVSGRCYTLTGGSICYTNGKAATYFPATTAGTATTGSQYY